jgi:hypothetical protein
VKTLVGASLVLLAQSASAANFSWRVDVLEVGEYFDATQSSRYRALAAVRPDFKLQTRDWLLLAKPRVEADWVHFQSPPPGVTDQTDAEVFVNEALVRYRPVKGLYLQAGRENLQWGPAYLLSVSNPFVQDNGRNNPTVEVAGLDYARATWIASPQWSVGAIANIAAGKLDDVKAYAQQYAVKVDYNGGQKYFSLIPSWREPTDLSRSTGDFRLGTYGGWTVNEALLLYGEGSYRHLGDGYALLGGGAYTFANGTNVAVEYYYNREGCRLEPYAQCLGPGPVTAIPSRDSTLYGLTRRNYVLLQLLDASSLKDWDFTARWIEGLDDGSGQIIGIAEYDVSRSLRLFLIGAAFFGREDTEYGAVLDGYASVGARLSF